ncbi:MAG: hypothetical protein ACXQS8_02905 [Candidatus Helarchaeales archaeon]
MVEKLKTEESNVNKIELVADPELIDKNSKILRDYWIVELDNELKQIKKQVKNFYRGIVGFFVNPIAGLVYDFFLTPDIREKTIRTIDIYLEAAARNISPSQIIELYFDRFKVNDLSYLRCKHNHHKFPELLERIKKSLVTRVISTRELLQAQGECYEDLIRNTYQNEAVAREELKKQLDYLEENLEFAIKHDLLNLNSLIRKQSIAILRSELEFKRKEFEKDIQKTFNSCS